VQKLEKNAIFLIDGSSFLYRAYYALRALHTSKGIPVQATYGFCRAIKKIIDEFEPQTIALVWDSKGETFRRKLYSEYKAKREAPPSDLMDQKKQIIEFAETIGLYQVAKVGCEADDLIASIAAENKKNQIVIITPDKDLHQLIDGEQVVVFDPFKKIIIDKNTFIKIHEFPPERLTLYHSLVGDPSDNIPGVKGIGKKTAQELVKNFETLDELYKNLDKIKKDRTKQLLEGNKEYAYLSLKLFTLKIYKLGISSKKLAFRKDNWLNGYEFFKKFEFESLLKGIPKKNLEVKKDKKGQMSLFTIVENDKKKEPPIKKAPWECIIVNTPNGLDNLITYLKKKKFFAFDTETTGVEPLKDRLVGISFAAEKTKAYYVPVAHTSNDKQLDRDYVIGKLKPILESKRIKKTLHNAKFDRLVLWQYGIEVAGIIFDSLLAANLLRKARQKIGLKILSLKYLDEPMTSFGDVIDKKYKNFASVPIENAAAYSAHDSLQTYKLKFILEKDIKKEKKLSKLLKKMELPFCDVLFRMEKEGIKLDEEIIKDVTSSVNRAIKTIEEKISAALKYKHIKNKGEINLNSPKQIEELLFDHLKLPVIKKSPEGRRSTAQEVLDELSEVHPIPGLILKYRELFKLKSGYLGPLPKRINPKTGRIHTSFNQTNVATGRLSSYNPNLQNIPGSSYYGMKIRSAFYAERGNIFLSADYSQIDLRVLAHTTKDKILQKAFLEGKDIHAQTAAQIFDVPIKKVSPKQRQVGKRINFSIIYGLTPYGLSKELGIKQSEAKTYIEKYFEQYPDVGKWMKEVVEEAKRKGYVETLFGRRRYVPELHESNKVVYEAARRVTINTPIQGTSAEIIKFAMIEIDKKFENKKLEAKMILQIHDELIFELPKKEKNTVQKVVRKCMEGIVRWKVPFIVDMRTGKTWEKISNGKNPQI